EHRAGTLHIHPRAGLVSPPARDYGRNAAALALTAAHCAMTGRACPRAAAAAATCVAVGATSAPCIAIAAACRALLTASSDCVTGPAPRRRTGRMLRSSPVGAR